MTPFRRAADWIRWAGREGIHPSVIRYITIYPEKLWDERNINPNPRGWHQVSQAIAVSYGLNGEEELVRFLSENPAFAERLRQEGIYFIGPPVKAIEACPPGRIEVLANYTAFRDLKKDLQKALNKEAENRG